MVDITALGELLIDFTPVKREGPGEPLFEANPGGAPCNALAMAAKTGKKAAFIGKVGNDMFGRQLAQAIRAAGVMDDGLVYDDEIPTTLAFVQLDANGDREFSFYRKPGADLMLRKQEVSLDLVEHTRIFHFGTISMTGEPSREATLYAAEKARRAGALISFDPNLRPPLWPGLDAAKAQMEAGMQLCDALKIADNELEFLTGTAEVEPALHKLYDRFGIKLIFATLGPRGAACLYKGSELVYCGADTRLKPLNTTGAGDTFFGAVLSRLAGQNPDALDAAFLKDTMKFGNTAAGLITQRHGSLRVMPSLEEIAAAGDYEA